MISFFLIFFWGLSNKRFTICVAGFSYLFFIHFILIKTFSSFDSITCNLIGNFFSRISKLSLTFPKAIMSFPFADVKILLLGSSIGVFNFYNRIFVIILVDALVLIITLTS